MNLLVNTLMDIHWTLKHASTVISKIQELFVS